MKKLFVVLVTAMLCFSAVGCGAKGETAEEAVTAALTAMKNLDQETFSKYVDFEVPDSQEGAEEVKAMLENLSFQITSSEETEDSATVQADITNIDMSAVMQTYIGKAFALAFSGDGTELTEEDASKMLMESIAENKENLVTTPVTIQLKKVEGNWKIDMDDSLQAAIYGGLSGLEEEEPEE